MLDLLKRARTELSSKYEVEPPNPIIVEIFPRKQEFAVRTFGLPGADGLLGVCFGRVVTANSPASQGEQPVERGIGPLARALPCGHADQDA